MAELVRILDRFHARFDGPLEGRRWIFLHGLMGGHQNWRPIISGIETTERCLSFDQRGHGRSFHPRGGFSPQDYAQDLHDILVSIGWQKVVLVGHSMGGRNAVQFAAKWPQFVEQLIVEDISPFSHPQNKAYYRNLISAVPVPFVNRAAAKEFFQNEFLKKVKTRENPQRLAEFLYANMVETADGRCDWRFSAAGILASVAEVCEDELWKAWESLTMPTLLMRGELSTELSSQNYEEMLRRNKLTQGIVVPGAGHWIHSDQPVEFLRILRNWIGF